MSMFLGLWGGAMAGDLLGLIAFKKVLVVPIGVYCIRKYHLRFD